MKPAVSQLRFSHNVPQRMIQRWFPSDSNPLVLAQYLFCILKRFATTAKPENLYLSPFVPIIWQLSTKTITWTSSPSSANILTPKTPSSTISTPNDAGHWFPPRADSAKTHFVDLSVTLQSLIVLFFPKVPEKSIPNAERVYVFGSVHKDISSAKQRNATFHTSTNQVVHPALVCTALTPHAMSKEVEDWKWGQNWVQNPSSYILSIFINLFLA